MVLVVAVCLTQFTDDFHCTARAMLLSTAASVVRSWYKMEHSNTNMSNEDRLFMSQTMGYPGQGSFTLTVKAGQVTSWRPHTIQPMDSLTNAMMNMEVQVWQGFLQIDF